MPKKIFVSNFRKKASRVMLWSVISFDDIECPKDATLTHSFQFEVVDSLEDESLLAEVLSWNETEMNWIHAHKEHPSYHKLFGEII